MVFSRILLLTNCGRIHCEMTTICTTYIYTTLSLITFSNDIFILSLYDRKMTKINENGCEIRTLAERFRRTKNHNIKRTNTMRVNITRDGCVELNCQLQKQLNISVTNNLKIVPQSTPKTPPDHHTLIFHQLLYLILRVMSGGNITLEPLEIKIISSNIISSNINLLHTLDFIKYLPLL